MAPGDPSKCPSGVTTAQSSGPKEKSLTSSEPVVASQRRTVVSSLAETIILPAGVNEADLIRPVCPFSSRTTLPEVTSQRKIALPDCASPTPNNNLLSGLKERQENSEAYSNAAPSLGLFMAFKPPDMPDFAALPRIDLKILNESVSQSLIFPQYSVANVLPSLLHAISLITPRA